VVYFVSAKEDIKKYNCNWK